jgi:hypothetical protein
MVMWYSVVDSADWFCGMGFTRWIESLQRYEQQRMWMQLGPPSFGKLPTRFERMYGPDKLTEFDSVFTQVRRLGS